MRCRQYIQEAILKEYAQELERSKQPGYVPPSFDEFDAGPEGDGSSASRTPVQGNNAVRGEQAPLKNPDDGNGLGVFA